MSKNREAWLTEAGAELATWLVPSPDMDKVRVSCSFPSTKALAKRKRIGEAWCPSVSEDGVCHIFISPVLSESMAVLETLLHELVHAAVGTECGHRGRFIVCAREVGFTKPWTSTPSSPELRKRLLALAKDLGPYPHNGFHPSENRKKQSTRLLKVGCQGCGCVVRMTRVWLESVGAPTCGCGDRMEEL